MLPRSRPSGEASPVQAVCKTSSGANAGAARQSAVARASIHKIVVIRLMLPGDKRARCPDAAALKHPVSVRHRKNVLHCIGLGAEASWRSVKQRHPC